MNYVLDTTAVSALMKGDPATVTRLARTPRTEVAVPQPVLAEIAYGLERLPPSARRTRLEARFELVKAGLVRTEWDDAVSEAFGTIKATLEKRGRRIDDFDAAIAAHAVATGATLVTSNTSHMARVPDLRVEDWSARRS